MSSKPPQTIHRILMVGNAAGGKTRLSRRLSELHGLPLTHVDSIQFLPGMIIRPLDETRKILASVTESQKWIIDGHGPLDQIENRFLIADRIVFVDLPLWRHYWWLTKRQLKSIFVPRSELQEGCNEATLEHTLTLIKRMRRMHQQMRPQLIRIFSQENLKSKVITIRSFKQWKDLYREGIQN